MRPRKSSIDSAKGLPTFITKKNEVIFKNKDALRFWEHPELQKFFVMFKAFKKISQSQKTIFFKRPFRNYLLEMSYQGDYPGGRKSL